ncbi:hypothetical protein PENTCL1PPCAC_28238, partial [Pristionchus entomophagus]
AMGRLNHREESSMKRAWTTDDLQQQKMQPPHKKFDQHPIKPDPSNPSPTSSYFIPSIVPAISVTSIVSESFVDEEKRPQIRFLRYHEDPWQLIYQE